MGNQDDVFYESEGDRWFDRNREVLGSPNKVSVDPVLRILQQATDLKPGKVLEIGCSNGWRLAEIHRRYGWPCVGVEPSLAAIRQGQEAFPSLELRHGKAAELPVKDSEFGLVIINYVLHWVARETLMKSISEIDRSLADGGFLIIGDFLPDVPTRRKYHHLPTQEVFTYKQDYPQLLSSTGLYFELARLTYSCDGLVYDSNAASQNRGVCSLLKKSLSNFYNPA